MASVVCTIAGGKGGVGRTTTAINVGAVFEEGGYDTVTVDADLGMTNVGKLLDLEPGETLHDVLAGDATTGDAATETAGGLRVITGDADLDAYARADPAKLRDVVDDLRGEFDVVLIDTSPKISHEMAVPLGLADWTVLVSTADPVALSDTARTAEMAERVGGDVVGTVVTRVTGAEEIDAVRERLDVPVLGGVPNDDDAVEEPPLVVNAGSCGAADAYRGVTTLLIRALEMDETPAEMETAFERSWVEDDATDPDDEQAADDDESDALNRFRSRF